MTDWYYYLCFLNRWKVSTSKRSWALPSNQQWLRLLLSGCSSAGASSAAHSSTSGHVMVGGAVTIPSMSQHLEKGNGRRKHSSLMREFYKLYLCPVFKFNPMATFSYKIPKYHLLAEWPCAQLKFWAMLLNTKERINTER